MKLSSQPVLAVTNTRNTPHFDQGQERIPCWKLHASVMPSAIRGALAGLIGGTILGGLINVGWGYPGRHVDWCRVCVCLSWRGFLLIGAGIAVGMAANALGEKARDACIEAGASSMSPSGTIYHRLGQCFYQWQGCCRSYPEHRRL
ncbi:Uncharacterised protein [Serratia fonticola]|uniref:Uncharacterized protein n=1 Tax=Serratia fonticola TaxID=47917 RepID=A0A4U9WEA4_SERFO|nr:Uncharacterised protein [Serratia fonticola]